MAEPFVGQITAVGFNFAPVGWLVCDGSLYPIAQYDVLYTLLGTT
ncbi:MAG: tail fiber protein [Acetobacteraceae bacterium]